jgi:phosphoglycolate phosphatase
MERLILFDIDGTLTRTHNGYLPFNQAILATFGIPGDIRTVVPDGNTDPRIVEDIFIGANAHIEVEPPQWDEFATKLERCYADAVRAGTTTVRPLPGAAELLRALSQSGEFGRSVVTGNFEQIAQVKLQTAGLDRYLSRGAYGSDSSHRPDLPAIARQRWETFSGRAISPKQCVIVGDTPKDLKAARTNGMKCVLVGTGRYPVEELRLASPDACLPDLFDTAEVLQTLGSL